MSHNLRTVFILSFVAVLLVVSTPRKVLGVVPPVRLEEPSALSRSTTTPTMLAPNDTQLELAGIVGGPMHSVAISGTLAFAGEGSALTVLDVSNAKHPERRSSLLLSGAVRDIEVIGTLAYLASEMGLHIVDVRDLLHPTLRHTFSQAETSQVQVVGNRAYLAYSGDPDTKRFGHLAILDIRDPSNISLLGRYELTTTTRRVQFHVVGNMAYVAAESLQMVDVRDPANPVLRGTYRPKSPLLGPEGFVTSVYVAGDIAYIGFGITNAKGACVGYVDVVRVTDPARPTRVTTAYTGCTGAIKVMGQQVFVGVVPSGPYGSSFGGLVILTASGSSLTVSGRYATGIDFGGVYDIQVVGTEAYLAASTTGFHIVDVTDPGMPSRRGIYNVITRPQHMQIVGKRAYVADGCNGMRILDVTHPATVTLVGAYDQPMNSGGFSQIPFCPYNVQVIQDVAYLNYSYLLDSYNRVIGLLLLDITDPTAPAFLGRHEACGYEMKLVDELAFINCSYEDIQILDLGNPRNPYEIGRFETTAEASIIEVANGLVYLDLEGIETDSLLILDASDPTKPVIVGRSNELPIGSAQMVGSLIYANGWKAGTAFLSIIDVHDPTAPALLSSTETGGGSLKVVGTFAYITTRDGLVIVDVTDPHKPAVRGSYRNGDLSSYYATTQVEGSLVYLVGSTDARYNNILDIVDVSNPDAPVLRRRFPIDEGITLQVIDDLLYAGGTVGLQIFKLGPDLHWPRPHRVFLPRVQR